MSLSIKDLLSSKSQATPQKLSKAKGKAKGKPKGKACAKTRHQDRYDSRGYALRALKEHFPGVSPVYFEEHLAGDSKSIIDKVAADHDEKVKENGNLGPNYWKELGEALNYGEDVQIVAVPSNKDEALSPVLIDARRAALCKQVTKRSHQPMVEFFNDARSVNNREYCGIINHSVASFETGETPMASKYFIALGRLIVRTKAHDKFKKETSFVLPHLEGALKFLWGSFSKPRKGRKNEDRSFAAFWLKYSEIGGLVVRVDKVEKVLSHDGDIAIISADAIALMRASSFMHAVLAPLMAAVQRGKAIAKLTADLDAITLAKKLDAAAYAALGCVPTSVDNAVDWKTEPCQISLNYRGLLDFEMEAKTWFEYHKLKTLCLVRSSCPAVKDMCWEHASMGAKGPFDVDAAIVNDINSGRKAIDDVFATVDLTLEETDVMQTLTDDLPVLESSCSSIKLELAILNAACGPKGSKIMESMVMHVLPDSGKLATLHNTQTALIGLKKSTLFLMGHDDTKKVLTDIVDLIGLMLSGTPPEEKRLKSNPFLAKVVTRLTFCCQWPEEGKAQLTGQAALQKHWSEQEQKIKNKTADLQDLDIFHSFMWLLQDEQQKEIQAAADHCLSNVSSLTKQKRKSVGGAALPKKQSKLKTKSADDDDELMKIFG